MYKSLFHGLLVLLTLCISKASGQEVEISLPRMAVLYKDVDNPISIAVENYSCDRIIVYCSPGTLKKISGCHYIFRDSSSAKDGFIKVGIPSGDTVKWLSSFSFRQKKLPCPEIVVAKSKYHSITKASLLQNPFIQLTYREPLFIPDTNLTIASWSVLMSRNDSIIFRLTAMQGTYFPEALLRMIEIALPGDQFVFSDFVLNQPNPACKIPNSLTICIL
jgi:hypothetical protein